MMGGPQADTFLALDIPAHYPLPNLLLRRNMNDPVPNLPLLRKVLDHIDAHPQEWNQDLWGVNFPLYDQWASKEYTRCGTAFCIAGHAVTMAGAEPVWEDDGTMNFVYYEGQRVFVSDLARQLLSLNYGEVTLFDSGNSREVIQEIAEEIAARAGEKL